MQFITGWGRTLPGAFHDTVCSFYAASTISNTPDWEAIPGQGRCQECSACIVVTSPTQEPAITRFGIFGPRELQQYEMEITEGILDFRIGHGWDYTYHDRIAKYLPWIKQELTRNPFSRRAAIVIRSALPSEIWGSDGFRDVALISGFKAPPLKRWGSDGLARQGKMMPSHPLHQTPICSA